MVKKSAFIAPFIAILLVFLTNVEAKPAITEEVRIGLYFTDPLSNIDTSVHRFSASSQNGLEFNWNLNGSNILIYTHCSGQPLLIEKDTREGRSESLYHISDCRTYSSFEEARTKADLLTAAGVEAFPVFNGMWGLAAGSYSSQQEAIAAIEAVKAKTGEESLSVMQPSRNAILVKDLAGRVVLAFSAEYGTLRICPAYPEPIGIISVNGNQYRGIIEVLRLAESDMTVINILDLEEYLYGVVPCEIQPSAHIEALKAQAVAARTFALKHLGKHENRSFNLCSTSNCQVYRGYDAEKPSTNMAVDETKGKVVTYNGSLASTYYFSSSGGATEDIANVWGGQVPYLVSVPDEYESEDCLNYYWEAVYTPEMIKSRLEEHNYNIGDVIDVKVTRRSQTGRTLEMVIVGTKGYAVFERKECRDILSSLKSQLFEIHTNAGYKVVNGSMRAESTGLAGKKAITAQGLKTLDASRNEITLVSRENRTSKASVAPTQYVFKGKGWGHGVGMSQEGAKGMAMAGFKYDEILMHYYTGTKVE